MNRIIPVLIVFLLVTSVGIPVVSAEQSTAYYELREMSHSHTSNHIGPAACVILIGMGYQYQGNDVWSIDYDLKYKRISACDCNVSTLVKLCNFIKSVDKCREEYDNTGEHVILTILSGAGTILGVASSIADDTAAKWIGTLVAAGFTVEEAHEAIKSLNAAINAKNEAFRLFEEL